MSAGEVSSQRSGCSWELPGNAGEGGSEGGEGGGAGHVETEPDMPVRLMPKVQTDEPLYTYTLGPWLAVLL